MVREDSEELAEVLDGAAVSAVSLTAIEVLRSILASVTIGLIGGSGYGIITSIQRSATTGRFVFGGLYTALKHSLPRYDPEDQNSLVLISILALLCALLLIAGLIEVFADQILAKTFLDSITLLRAGIVYGIIFLIVMFTSELLKAYKEIRYANLVLRWAAPGLQIIGIIAITQIVPASVLTVLSGMIGGLVLAAALGTLLLWQKTPLSLLQRTDDYTIIASYGQYLGPAAIASILIGVQFGGYNIMMFSLEPTAAGVFGIGLILATLTRLPLNAINQIFPQVASELYSDGNKRFILSLYQSTSKMALYAAIPIGIVFGVFHERVAGLFAESYVTYASIIPMMAFAQILAVLAGTVGFLLMMTDNERKSMWLQIGLTSITLAVIVLATREYGVLGLAAAYLFGYTFNNAAELVLLYHLEELTPFTSDHLSLLGTGVIATAILAVIPSSMLSLRLLATVTVIGGYLIISYRYWINSAEKEAIQTCRANISSRIRP